MDNNIKQNDWVAINLLNTDVTIDKLAADGINSLNTSIRPKEDYLQSDKVKEFFKDDSGKFNEALFDQFYAKALQDYTSFSTLDTEKWLKDSYEYDAFDINRDAKSNIKKGPTFEIKKVSNPFETTSYFHEGTEGPRALSIAELAQKNKYFDTESGTWSDKTPNDLGALGVLTSDTLVLAQWDEDGEHTDIDGNIVKHSKGDYKYDSDGKFYYETLNGREYYGKQVLGVLDVLTTDGSAWNKVDIFDTDSIEVNPVRSVARTLAVMAPYLIPGVGEYWAGMTAAMYLSESMPALIKTFGGLLDSEYRPSSALNKFEGFMQKFNSTPSEYNQAHSFSFDNICQFASTSAQQLFQQRWVANIPKMLGMDRRLEAGVAALQGTVLDKAVEKGLISKGELVFTKEMLKKGQIPAKVKTIIESMPEYKAAYDAYNKYQKASTAIARAYLVTTAAAQTYGDAIQNGFDRQTASVISTAVYTGFHTLFQFDYFKHYLLTGVDLNEERMALRELVYNYLKDRGKTELTQAGVKGGFVGKFKSFTKTINDLWTSVVYGGRRGILTSTVSEATEEVMEELMTDFAQGVLGNGLNAIRKELGYETQGHFDYTASDPIQRYLVSFIGGGIGGTVFGLENWWRTRGGSADWSSALSKRPEMARAILQKVNAGQKDEIIKIAQSFKGKALGSNTLSYDERAEDGSYLPASDKSKTQNSYLIDSFINHINTLDLFLEQEGIKYSKDDLANVPIYRSLTALQISQQAGDDGKLLDLMADDLTKLQLQLNDVSSELFRLQKDEKTDPQIIKAAQAQFDYYKDQIHQLVSGGNEIYFGRMMASYTPSVFGLFYSPNVENYAKQVFNYDYSKLNDTLKAYVDEKYANYVESKQSEIDSFTSYQLYRRMSELIADNLKNREGEILDEKLANLADKLEMDPSSGRLIYKDRNNGFMSYNELVGIIHGLVGHSSLRNNLPIIKSLANYLYSVYNGDNVIPESYNLFDVFEFEEAVESAYDLDEKGNPVVILDDEGQPTEERVNSLLPEDPNESVSSKIVGMVSDFINGLIDTNATEHQDLAPDVKRWQETLEKAKDVYNVVNNVYRDIGNDNIEDILKQLGLNSTKLVDEELIKYESGKQTYILETPVRQQLDNLNTQLFQVEALLRGATSVTRSVDNLTSINEVINDFNKSHKNPVFELPIISDKVKRALTNRISLVQSQIAGLEAISDANANNENIKEQKLSVSIKQDRIDIYKQLNEKDSIFTKNSLPELPTFEFIDNIVLDDLDKDAISEADIKFEQALINNEAALITYYRGLTPEQKDTFIGLLCDLFPEFSAEPAYLSLNKEQNVDHIHTMDALNFWYLMSNLISEPATFYKPYKEVIEEGQFEKAPYYSQEFLVKQAIQYLNGDKVEIRRIISVVQQKAKDSQSYSVLENMFRFCAGSGVGKSVAILPLIQLVQNKIENSQYLFSAPTEANLEKLNADRASKYTIANLFKLFEDGVKIIDNNAQEQINYTIEDFKKYTTIEGAEVKFNSKDYGLAVSDDLRGILQNNFLTIIIDEGTYVSREQYLLLDELAKQLNFKIVTTGDILQSGYSNEKGELDSFDRCLTFIGSSLYESKRVTTNIGKWNSGRLIKFPYNLDSTTFELQYAENESDVVGIKNNAGVLTQEALNEFAKAHPDSTILLYDIKKNGLIPPKNVVLKTEVVAVQGQEFDYVLINGDLNFQDGPLGIPSRKDVYTILTRGKNATIIHGLLKSSKQSVFTTTQKEWKDVYSIGINEESIKTYQEYRKESLSKLSIPELNIATENPTEAPNEDIAPTKQLTVNEVPLIRSMLRVHTFFNRLGGMVDSEQVYHRGNDTEDINLFLTEDADIRSEAFKIAATQLNALRNNLYLKLTGAENYNLYGVEDTGEFLIKVSPYDSSIDNAWGVGNFDPNKDLSKAKIFRRLVYKDGDKEVTLAIFPNAETVGKGINVAGDTKLLDAIQELDAKQNQTTYYRFDSEKLNFYTPDSPIFFDPMNKGFDNQRYWTPYRYSSGTPDFEYSFFESTKPIRVNDEWLTDKRGEYSISELYTEIDALYKVASDIWDSHTSEGNPFKQRNEKVREVSKITASAVTIFAKLRSNYTDKAASLDNSINQYINDLKQTYRILTELVRDMKKYSEWSPAIMEQFIRKARIRISVQPIQLYYNYAPTADWEDKFKEDVRIIGTKESHNKLYKNIAAWTQRLIALKQSGKPLPEWISKLAISDLQDIANRVDFSNEDKSAEIIFAGNDPITELRVNQVWDIYKSIYSDYDGFVSLLEGINTEPMFKLYSKIFANYHQTDFDKTYRTNNVPTNLNYTADNNFVYERGWSVMSYYDYEQGLNSVFTEVTEEAKVEPTQEVVETVKEQVNDTAENLVMEPSNPEEDILTEECMDLLDEYNDYVHSFVHFIRQENNGIFVTRQNIESGNPVTYKLQLGNQVKSFTFSRDVAEKLDAYMNNGKNVAIFEKMKNKYQLVSSVKELLDILTAGEEC